MGQGPFDALLHCFTSSRALAETALELGLSISFSGVVTFKNSDDLRAIARDVPLDRHPGRDRRALSRPGAPSRQAQRAGLSSPRPRRRSPKRKASRPKRSRRRRAPTRCGFSRSSTEAAPALSLRLTILGCGSSAGVPRVGQGWGACDPANPRNRRRRCSVLVERVGAAGVTTVLIDAGPDLREQLIDADVRRVDAVLITHPHADHTHGIDDLRPLYLQAGRRIDIHMDEPTALTVRKAFPIFSRRLKAVPILRSQPICGLPQAAPAESRGRAERSRRRRSTSTTATSTRSGFASAASPTRLTSNAFRRRAGRSWRGSTSGSSTRCAIGRIRRISASTRRWRRSRRCGRGGRS